MVNKYIIKELRRKSRIYAITSLILCLLDCFTNFTVEVIDILFTQKIEGDDAFDEKFTRVAIEIALVTGFLIFVIVNILRRKRHILTFVSYAYLILGLCLFCYLLISRLKEIRDGKGSSFSRPILFYQLHLNIVLLILILFGILSRISSITFIFLLSSKLTHIENLIKCNLCEYVIEKNSESDQCNNKSDVEQSKKSKKEGVINFINHSCESVEKESESLEKENDNLIIVGSPNNNNNNQNNNILINARHERKVSLVDYYKKIVK